jgi:hypothetical protein
MTERLAFSLSTKPNQMKADCTPIDWQLQTLQLRFATVPSHGF